MSLKDTPQAPAAPNYAAAATAQGEANLEASRSAAQANRPDIYTPLGSQLWSRPSTVNPDLFRQDINLSPAGQGLFDTTLRTQQKMADVGDAQLNRASGALSSPVNFDNAPKAMTADDLEGMRKNVTDALYKRSTDMLDPQFALQEQKTRQRLADQGFQQGDAGYSNPTGTGALDQFDRAKQLAYGNARDSAIAGGGAEVSRDYGISADARKQAVTEALALRNQPLNELSAFRSGSQVSMPQFQATPAMSTPGAAPIFDATKAGYDASMGAYNAQQASANNTSSGLFGIGAAAATNFPWAKMLAMGA